MPTQKSLLLIVVSLCIFSPIFGQQDKANLIKSLIKEIAANDLYERTYTVGYFGAVSRQMQLFQELMSNGSECELTEIALNNKNAVVRLYAFQAIKMKVESISHSLIEKFTSDSSQVITLIGCLGSKETVNKLAFEPLSKQKNFVQKYWMGFKENK